MAPSRKTSASPFTTLRIIGERAQKILQRARSTRWRSPEAKRGRGTGSDHPAVRVQVSLSVGSVLRGSLIAAAIACGAILVFLLQDKIVLLLLGVFVAVVVDPGVKALGRLRIPRGLAVVLQYIAALLLLLFLLVSLIPVIAEQMQQLGAFLSMRINAFLATPSVDMPFLTQEVNVRLTELLKTAMASISLHAFTSSLQQIGQNLAAPAQGSLLFAARLAGSVLDFFMNLFLVLVLALFMQLEKEHLIAWTRSFLPWTVRTYVDDKSELIHWKLAQWVRGQILLCLFVTILVYLALVILRMPYALTLAVLAGFAEMIPVVGLFFAAIPAILITLTQQGLLWAVMVACLYYIIHWCEGNLLVPLIMRRTVGLSPIVILLSMLIGVSFPSVIHPVLGIMLSIPAATVVALFLEDWREKRMRNNA